MDRRPTDRPAPLALAAILGCLAFAAAAVAVPGPALAQWGDSYDPPPADPYAAPPPRRRGYRDDGYARPPARRYVPQPQQESRQFFWPWEDQPRSPPPPPPSQGPSQAAPGYARPPRARPPAAAARPEEERAARRRRPSPPPAVAQPPKPTVPKAEPTTRVAIFGDSLANYLGKGIDDAFSDNADVAVLDRSKGDSGLVRRDVVDWAKASEDFLKATPNLSYALMMVGVNDRQAIREGDQNYEPLSDSWREIYAARVDAVVKVFAEHKVPLIWVGLPPVRSESLTRDFAAINDLVRERVQKAGQSYVEIWQGFVDDRNRFTVSGPDVDGQEARLRTSDGIHFTSAGARKVAHFADVELKRLMGVKGGLPPDPPPAVAAVPSEGAPATGFDDTAAIDRKITAMLPSLPEPPGIPSLPVKPAAGPVVPLGRAETSPGGTLLTGRPHEGDATGTRERSLQRGAAPLPQPGRADDFRWPPG
ncbi:SGNH/GDSL hydrolase family protein [Methylobacterium sp. Leaf118]|uniref:SGNH/GDSL hydrolase family protein n=1 Tax=Methylobacterium sp. Leaf118 TaxID=2876562 RepID=UPI001E58C4FC|nr:SGNH family hydrolase [Methylobacterium sp. Leaf118]